MNEQSQRPSRQWRPRIWRGLVAAGGILLVLLGLHVTLTHIGVARRLKAIRAAGYPTTLAQWTDSQKVPKGTPNAAEIYEEAFKRFVMPTSDVAIRALGRAAMPREDLTWDVPMLAQVSQYLADNQSCLALLHEAAQLEQCRYDWPYVPRLGEIERAQSCAYLLGLEMLLHAHRGDAAAVVTSFKSALRLIDSLRCEPTLGVYVIRTVRLHASLMGLERALGVASFADEQLCELREILTRVAVTPNLAGALVSERCWAVEACRDASAIDDNLIGGGGILLRFPSVMKTALIDTLDCMTDAIEVLKLPSPERLPRFRAIDAEYSALPFWHVVSKRSPMALGLMCKMDLQLQARIDMARTALAIERCRLGTGQVPKRLDALVPKYLDAVPIDPFDGQPIRYRSTEPGYLLYSVSDDGQDNGGIEQDKKDRNAPYDLCLIVTQ